MTTIDEQLQATGESTQEFAERIVGAVDSASLSILMSIGHRTQLFDTIGELPPSTRDQVAEAAGLTERYVREWLGAMVAGRIVEYDPAEKRTTCRPPRRPTHRVGRRTISRGRHRSCRCSARSNRRSWIASTTAAACPTATIHASTS